MSGRGLIGALVLLAIATTAAGAEGDIEHALQVAMERGDLTAARSLIAEGLAAAPADPQLRFQRARILTWSGDLTAALAQYDELLAQYPNDVDYVFGRAQVLVWADEREAALAELARARSLADSYEAIWQLEAQILERMPGRAAELERLRESASRRFPDSSWWREAAAPSDRAALRLEAGLRKESLSSGVADWSSRSVTLRYEGSRRLGGYAGFRRETRFDLGDTLVDAGGSWRLSGQWIVGAALSASRSPSFSAELDVAVWAARSWPNGWESELRMRRSHYEATSVTSFTLAVARYVGDFRLGYAVIPTRLPGSAGSSSHVLTMDYYWSDRTSARLALTGGSEVETIAPGEVARSDVVGALLLFRHALNSRWDLSWELGGQRQGDFYRRRSVGVSISARI